MASHPVHPAPSLIQPLYQLLRTRWSTRLRPLKIVMLDNIGKSKMSGKEILGEFALLYRSLESLTGNEKLRAMFWKEFSQKTLLLWSVTSYIQPFIDKYIDLFTRKGDITFFIVLLNMKLCQCLKADRHITTMFFAFSFITTRLSKWALIVVRG